MTISFESKVALVTGAGAGLGLATAKAFAQAGARVALADGDEAAVRSDTAEATRGDYDRVMAVNLRGVWSCMIVSQGVVYEPSRSVG